MAYIQKTNAKFNNLSTMDPGKTNFTGNDDFNYQNYNPMSNSKVYFNNMPPEVMQKLRDGEIRQLGPDFNCYVKVSPQKQYSKYEPIDPYRQDYIQNVKLFDQSNQSPFKMYGQTHQGSQFQYVEEEQEEQTPTAPKFYAHAPENPKSRQIPKQMSFVEFDSNNAVIKTILEEIEMIMTKLDLRAN
jgi:hypothetical protein